MTATLDATHPQKLEALLRLLDDDTPLVRDAVTKELAALGTGVGRYIYDMHLALDALQWNRLRDILFDGYQQQLRKDWSKWLLCDSDAARLEAALGLLARFQNGPHYRPPIADALDKLSAEYAHNAQKINHTTLARFLFNEKGFHSVDEEEEDTDTSNLAWVLEKRQGLPISLVCVYMLIAHRHGLKTTGCNWPGSFYARFMDHGRLYVVDCNNHGLVLEADELLRLQGPSREAAEAVLTLDVDATTMVRRVLSNLAFGYRRAGSGDSSLLMLDLLRSLEQLLKHGFGDTT